MKIKKILLTLLCVVMLCGNIVNIAAYIGDPDTGYFESGPTINEKLKSIDDYNSYTKIQSTNAPSNAINTGINIGDASYSTTLLIYTLDNTIYLSKSWEFLGYNDDSSYMFSGLSNIKEIDLSYGSYLFDHVTNADYMFAGCESLEVISIPANFLADKCSTVGITDYAYKDQNGVVYPAGTFPVDNSEPLTLRRLDDINVDVSTGQSQNASVQVFANIPSTYAVTLPKRVDIGSVDSFEIYAKGDITENETLTIDVPDTSILSEEGGVIAHDDITLYYETSKSSFAYTDLGSEYQSMNGNNVSSVYIDHDPIPAGHWRSQVPITISLTQGKQRFSIPDVVDTFPYLQRDTASNIIEIFDIYMSPV